MEVTSWHQKDEYLRSVYFALVIGRFLFPCLVQNGYLYPDEFFQSSEIMANDILQINSTVTWEWNEAFPVRSPVSAFLASGIPFLILSALSKLKLVHISPYFLLMFPRIYITSFSVISCDIPVYVISRRLKLNPFQCLFVLSTSYVMHVLATRPFSNMMETGIFGLLLMLLIRYPGNQQKVTNIPGTNEDRLVDNDIQSYTCILVGGLTSLGLFCRQTFLVFSLVPYLGYIIDQMKRQQNYKIQIVSKLMFIALGFLAITVVFVLLDSWYFGYLQYGKIVVTPWNFLQYNSLQSHTHGYHPFFTHFFINIPLLFGPIAFLVYLKLGSLLVSPLYHSNHDQQSQNQVDIDYRIFYKVILLFCILVPVLILSFIPHQEPRFIMPVLLPLVLLFAIKVVGPNYSPTIFMSWTMWNVIGFVFFGVLHQGGVVPSLFHLHKVINQKALNSTDPFCHHVVYFHTYMPPTHLLAWPKSGSLNGHKLYIHDLAGSSQETFDQRMSKIKSDYCVRNTNMVYIVYPGTVKVRIDFEEDLNVVKFFPHLTMEDPPNFHQYMTDLFFSKIDDGFGTSMHNMDILNICRIYWNHIRSRMEKLKCELSLKLYTTQF